MAETQFIPGVMYEVFIGIKDKDSYEEVLDVESFKGMLAEICNEKQVSFSLLTQFGGYTHGKGYTTETSFRIILLGLDEDEIMLLGERLKQAVNTDTILVTKTDVEYCFV